MTTPIKFTSEHGGETWVVAEHITNFHTVAGRTSIDLTSGKYVLVSDSPEEVASRIKAAAQASLMSTATFGVIE